MIKRATMENNRKNQEVMLDLIRAMAEMIQLFTFSTDKEEHKKLIYRVRLNLDNFENVFIKEEEQDD